VTDPTAAGVEGAPADLLLSDDPQAVKPRPRDEAVDALRQAVNALGVIPSKLEALLSSMEKEHERAAFRESVIDRLHAENQQLRRGELEALLDPVRGGLFRVHDMARRAAEQCRAAAQGGAELLDAVADEAADVLRSVGVERFEVSPGEDYDATRHRSVGAVAVDEAWRDRTVFDARSAGFTAPGGRVIRKANVVVARYSGAAGSTGESAAGEETGGEEKG
jgi:molecular chaperone GrpE (heat shock protein)